MKRLVILISGNGSNLQAILDACASGELNAEVVSVISNKADAYGLTRARNAGMEAIYFAKQENESRRDYDVRLADEVTSKQADYIVLAGWMRILSSAFLSSFPNKVINLHPALPDTFPGTHAIERAFEAYQHGEIDHTGVMVHLVPDEGVDNGPVLAMEIVSINKEDTLETLEARVHQTEHVLLVKTLKRVIETAPRKQCQFTYKITGISLTENIEDILEEMNIRYQDATKTKIWRDSSDVLFSIDIARDIIDLDILDKLILDDLWDSVFATIKDFKEISFQTFSKEQK
jgi:formyltetrahydrofolate-dependent phosphoribosylglycinamide formyltransferase